MDSNIISLTDAGKGLKDDTGKMYYVNPVDESHINEYYVGVIDQEARPDAVDINLLSVIEQSSDMVSLGVIFDDSPGWLVLMEPVNCPIRVQWFVSVVNFGVIGGSYEGIDPNLFPDFYYKLHQGRLWRLYLSSYITQVSQQMFFNS